MYLQHIHIKDFRGIKEISLSLPADEKKQWIFLTGENGHGKTVFLQALALGLVGGKAHSHYNFYVNHLEENPSLKIKHSLSPHEIDEQILGYGYARLQKGKTDPYDDWMRSRIYSLFRENAVMEDIEEVLKYFRLMILNYEHWESNPLNENDSERDVMNYMANRGFYEYLLKILQNVLPSKEKITISYLNKGLRYHLSDSNTPLSHDQISLGYRGIINLVSDIILKLNKNHETRAIVLIDEFDAHLHPKWQREFVKKLSEIFPNVQFIVSTHSPIPILGAAKESTIILNVEQSKEEGITVRRLDDLVDFENMLPNTLLSSPIFGLYDLVNPNRDEKELLLNPNDYSESVFETILENKLKQKAAEMVLIGQNLKRDKGI